MESPDFLKKKYDLHNTPEVDSAVKRTEKRTGERVPQDPSLRIQNYLDRFNEILDRTDPDKRERGIEAMKRLLHDKFVIKPDAIPEGYFENQRRIAREQGHGDIEIRQEQKNQLTEVIITDQESSLDNWIDYLASADAPYPDWLKYYAVRSILGMGEFDKEKKQFSKRSQGTVKPFPDLNREALAYVLDAIEKKYKGEPSHLATLEVEDKEQFNKLLQGENFAKLYAWAIEKVTPASQEALANTEGKWVKYEQGSDHMPLVASLQGHGTGWCTAGESTAQAQLQGGDFYVYYSLDQQGNPTIPRAAIRMQEGNIAEVRGIAKEQNLDPYIAPVVQEKMKSFPDGQVYEKKAQDMKILTALENKSKKKKELSKEDLIFLYEINTPIEGFGYQRDPRIDELRNTRNLEEDMPIVLECAKEQIAHDVSAINATTKAYLGKLVPGIFDKIQEYGIEHIYTSFPEGKIRREQVEVGGKTREELESNLAQAGVRVSGSAKEMMQNKDFKITSQAESIDLIRLKVGDLGFPPNTYPTTDEIYTRIKKLGLELCPAEVGPHYRLQYNNQPMNEWIYVGMKQIADSRGYPRVFELEHYDCGLWLYDIWATPGSEWDPDYKVVFRLRKETGS